MNPKFREWSDEELKELKQRFPHRPTRCLLHVLPGRSKSAINAKAGSLGIKKTLECRREIAMFASPWDCGEDY